MNNENKLLKLNYDNVYKKILSQKDVLAWIMKSCISEYKNCSINDIVQKYIEGSPQIEFEEIDDDAKFIKSISGLNSESSSFTEGFIKYDIKYNAIIPKSHNKAQLIINIEAQSNEYTPYPIMKRAMYYASRLISSQKGVNFSGSNYNDLNKVYSIWIFTKKIKNRKSSITKYKFKEYNEIGEYNENINNYDLIEIDMVRLGDKDNKESKSKIIDLLKILFDEKSNINVSLKDKILREKYGVNLKPVVKKELLDMGGWAKEIEDKGIEKGIEKGTIRGMLMLNADIKQIIELTGASEQEILSIKNEIALGESKIHRM